jgi:hypothetical protein
MAFLKNITMSSKQNNQSSDRKPGQDNSKRPDEGSQLDSRKNEEQDFKGSDTTHNKKETHNEKSKGKK